MPQFHGREALLSGASVSDLLELARLGERSPRNVRSLAFNVSCSPTTMSDRRLRTLARGLLLCGIAGVTSGCGTGRPSEYKIPSGAARQTNPFPVTPESIVKGKDLYVGGGCAICHGKDGDGKGVLAKDISMNLHNWRDPSVQAGFTDGELFYIMQNGKGTSRGRMPRYRDQETPEQIWYTIHQIARNHSQIDS